MFVHPIALSSDREMHSADEHPTSKPNLQFSQMLTARFTDEGANGSHIGLVISPLAKPRIAWSMIPVKKSIIDTGDGRVGTAGGTEILSWRG